MKAIEHSELILNPDGSIYHLHLRPENIADTILLVGDQGRVNTVSKFFDHVEFTVQNREFVTHTGVFKNKRLTVMSTGIGNDNIDIVLNELDALANIDLKTRTLRPKLRSLKLIRIGTSGALQADIPVDATIFTSVAMGFDTVLNFYAKRNQVWDNKMQAVFMKNTEWSRALPQPYFVKASKMLHQQIGYDMLQGITVSASGFYGPQGRVLRLPLFDEEMVTTLSRFNYEQMRVTNFEMESSALYGLSGMLGHEAATVCCIIANRQTKQYSKNYNRAVEKLIGTVLERVTQD